VIPLVADDRWWLVSNEVKGRGDPFSASGRIPPIGPSAPAALDLSAILPAFYLREPGAFPPLAEAVLGTIDRVAAGIREEAVSRGAVGGGPGRHAPLAGTERALRAFLAERSAARPAVWHGVEVRPAAEAGELEIVPAPAPSAVVVWPEDAGDAVPASAVPPDLLPAGGRLAAVRLAGPPPVPAIAGDRFRGEVLG
jgi:hypothetical protein